MILNKVCLVFFLKVFLYNNYKDQYNLNKSILDWYWKINSYFNKNSVLYFKLGLIYFYCSYKVLFVQRYDYVIVWDICGYIVF